MVAHDDSVKKWSIPGRITGGECVLFVRAETREEALRLFQNSDWEAESGSWECEPDVDSSDSESLDAVMEEG